MLTYWRCALQKVASTNFLWRRSGRNRHVFFQASLSFYTLGSEPKRSLKRGESTVFTVQRKLPMNLKLILSTVTDNTSKLPVEYSLGLWAWRGTASYPAGKPTQNGFIESFNGRFRDECLNEHWFSDIVHARKTINDWRQDYNECRPHSSLNYQTPA